MNKNILHEGSSEFHYWMYFKNSKEKNKRLYLYFPREVCKKPYVENENLFVPMKKESGFEDIIVPMKYITIKSKEWLDKKYFNEKKAKRRK